MYPKVFVSFLEKGRYSAPDLTIMNEEKCRVRNQTINGLSEWVSTLYLRLICVLTFFLFIEGLKQTREILVLDRISWYVPILFSLPLSITTMRSICGRSVRLCVTKIESEKKYFIPWVNKGWSK